MTTINNQKKKQEDDVTALLRGAIEHRATWMGLTYLAAKEAGCDAEKITRAAIRKTGNIHGANIKKAMENGESLVDFRHAFLTTHVINIFEMDIKELETENFKIEFNYCPLVSAWQKLGMDNETIDLLCDMAMDGDRGIAEVIGATFELGDTIAKGCATCKLHFSK
ncbi:L-2-amino-thiazoline-4-carboxylic acid hydrolase [Anoxynatronum buryatiense]|uniref:L-2-amino-thiazoline-4-carboxylic acid hydrolase n=1 Tax=Anoxynatronum buryatiense TaxID=489973 RepID=A0AA46AJ40_9CLOT|nr:L-2-amino-thiazoline-4-carboxylic acid hydrolase [Anoxynatronum buryatiense]SMP56204.1 L-2-amino-thiazoline-4-carboxylic acid hydrolase [Anoxynatronum buryatiense]